MADSQLLSVGAPSMISDTYFPIIGPMFANTEALSEVPIRYAGVVKWFYTYVSAGTTPLSYTFTVRKNRANTALAVTYSSAQTGTKESSSTVSVAATDEINCTGANTDPNIVINVAGLRFSPTNASTIVTPVAAIGSVSINNSTTVYNAVNGELLGTTTEANTKFSAGYAMTATNLYCNLSLNSLDSGSATMRIRVNGANVNSNVSYSATQTGIKEDTINTDDISIGDDVNYSTVVTGSIGSITAKILCCHLIKNGVTAATSFYPLMASSTDGVAVSFNTTTYCGCAGDLVFTTTENNTRLRPRFNVVVKFIGAYASANTIATSATSVLLRRSSADTAVSVSFNAAQTGLKTDSTDTVTISSAVNFMNYKVATPNTSGSITLTWIGLFSKAEGLAKNLFLWQALNRAGTY